MFEVGDKIVCINNGSYGNSSSMLSLYETYTVYIVRDIWSKANGKMYNIVNLVGLENMGFNQKAFVHLRDFRLKKLQKICSKLEIK